MKTADEIKDALGRCAKSRGDCDGCPYRKDGCSSAAMGDALERIKGLEGMVHAYQAAEARRRKAQEIKYMPPEYHGGGGWL